MEGMVGPAEAGTAGVVEAGLAVAAEAEVAEVAEVGADTAVVDTAKNRRPVALPGPRFL
jgi:hypothetical protein